MNPPLASQVALESGNDIESSPPESSLPQTLPSERKGTIKRLSNVIPRLVPFVFSQEDSTKRHRKTRSENVLSIPHVKQPNGSGLELRKTRSTVDGAQSDPTEEQQMNQDDHALDVQDKARVTWLIQQCHGIAEALYRIHRYNTTSATSIPHFMTLPKPEPSINHGNRQSNGAADKRSPRNLFGRHGDIKPANILWFPDKNLPRRYGLLKIADFGTARFTDDKRAAVQDRDVMPRSETYMAPEWRLPDSELSIQCDIWALGCIFLEFLCWYFEDWQLVQEFARQRTYGYESDCFFTIEMTGKTRSISAKVKEPVSEMLEELRKRSRDDSNNCFLGILDTIQNDMLVVQGDNLDSVDETNETESSPASGFLKVNHEARRRRKSSGNIARDLGSIVQALGQPQME
ncbi:hypothetical protein N0V83_008448 [Neocucurbitaria cava]|uniref:Protein kinase domain-containing protein n=1 Tax=Neocucurbitaria cava TaxID=798079 RepID=A0A9W9CJN5_9PLEO|nr:hypothetical protein N0V83_008448 [Neocucurbitaria cava]